ncbi:VQ motif-containing protein 25 [Vitis vinifera]|uniref:VQ motif-containing protein 25 n=1 Tax=Vitis vinifera TaxID=29760 RepID=A0A438HAK7_VITVI|nr:VQ motif-containing protein 25 [Vitis vinifera]
MEEMMAGREGCNPNSTPSPLPMHNHSHTISKVKPKIRIIHIFAPEIIKTDVENFRELVQRLTGKPSAADKGCRKKNMARGVVCNKGVGKKKMAEFRGLESRERIKGKNTSGEVRIQVGF